MSLFRVCYQLVAGIDGGNDTRWFFTFANRLGEVMGKTFKGKHTYPKRWRGRWLIIRYNGMVCPREGMYQIWG